jgi:hypothetical protein
MAHNPLLGACLHPNEPFLRWRRISAALVFIIFLCFSFANTSYAPFDFIGSRISLISKKNIRYEGTLYLINEADATVALQNVRSYGTEGRESETETFVPAQDQVYPHLLFRGCDIKDLHVHENTVNEALPNDPAIISAGQPPEIPKENEESAPKVEQQIESKSESHVNQSNENASKDVAPKEEPVPAQKSKPRHKKSSNPSKSKKMIGTGASLLNRKARGGVDGVEGELIT